MRVPVLLLADDLSGAAEAAAAFLARTPRIVEWRGLREVRDVLAAGGVVAVDTDSRYATSAEAARRCRTALAELPAGGMLVKKIDSTLRGPLAAELGALHQPGTAGGLLVVAPALPAVGRTVLGGTVRVDGVALERSGAWAAEPRPAPSSVAEALAPLPVAVVGLVAVRGPADALAAALRTAARAGAVAACDAETDDDLDRIVRAGRLTGLPVRWAGSAGLAHALARTSRAPAAGSTPPAPMDHPAPVAAAPVTPAPVARLAPAAGPALFVVGTAAPVARDQVARLAEQVDTVVELDPARLGEPAVAAELAARSAGRTAVVHLAVARGTARAPDVVAGLARAVAPAAAAHPALVLTGGETARAVLAAIGAGELLVRDAWEDGIVVSTTSGGHVVVTKPGAFGGPDALLRIARRLAGAPIAERVPGRPAHEEDT